MNYFPASTALILKTLTSKGTYTSLLPIAAMKYAQNILIGVHLNSTWILMMNHISWTFNVFLNTR